MCMRNIVGRFNGSLLASFFRAFCVGKEIINTM